MFSGNCDRYNRVGMEPDNDGQHKPKTQMWAGGIICLVAVGTAAGMYFDGMPGSAFNMLLMAALGAWTFHRGRVRQKAADAEAPDTPTNSSGKENSK